MPAAYDVGRSEEDSSITETHESDPSPVSGLRCVLSQ